MKRMKVLAVLAAAVLMLAFGAVTVYAVSADQGKAPRQEVLTDCVQEEMAVGAYYESQSNGEV